MTFDFDRVSKAHRNDAIVALRGLSPDIKVSALYYLIGVASARSALDKPMSSQDVLDLITEYATWQNPEMSQASLANAPGMCNTPAPSVSNHNVASVSVTSERGGATEGAGRTS